METAVTLRSYHCTVGTILHAGSGLEKSCMIPMHNAISTRKISLGLGASGRLIPSPWERKRLLLPSIRSSEASLAVTSDSVPSNSYTKGPLEKKPLQTTTFPNAFESLVMEVCDETDIAELKVKVGGFEMHLKRNVGAAQVQSVAISSHSSAPDVPSKPVVGSLSAALEPIQSSKSSPTSNNPFSNVSLSSKALKLASLEASGNTYVLISSPTVGTFRRGKTVKGKKQPPICEEGDMIKEGQVIGYLDQFGSELPVKSDVAGEVLKLLYKEGEAVGYGDPLVAVLPSFSGIAGIM
ncbi:hypothetical protein H6P81_016774 [Aristolochia fimbriata]|uniref:Lipoyl-binding domain-containing protein n=1 Tax=Aristolochia fimbriata TaxID=158543 RepID=A0AAV7EAY4_ARIFI|nr:hypothetical protein H6P81_016774 [Aristolochia fimbriata]